ncbi:hypothetical protein EJB05_09236, partial [Eragrostis curvula]
GASLPAAWNYGAVERALRDSSQRGDRRIFEPTVGKVFDSTEEAFEFFNMFSWEVGFGIRFGRSRSNKSGGVLCRTYFVCVCEWLPIYCGVLFWVTIVMKMQDRRKTHGVCVSRFVPEHNHPLSSCCGERRQWISHSRIDKMTRDLVRHLRDNNVQISRVCSIVGSMHGPSP